MTTADTFAMYDASGTISLTKCIVNASVGQLIAASDEKTLTAALDVTAVKAAAGWLLPDGTDDEKKEAVEAISVYVGLLEREEDWNRKNEVGKTVFVRKETKRKTATGYEISVKYTRHRTVGKAGVVQGEIRVPVRKGKKRVLVPLSDVRERME